MKKLGAVLLLGAFVASQGLLRQPLVPLAVFRRGNLSAANLTLLLLGGQEQNAMPTQSVVPTEIPDLETVATWQVRSDWRLQLGYS